MARSKLIHNYLSELEIYLSRISEVQALEVVQEIESHIYEALSLRESSENTEIKSILAKLGTPRELAAGYIEHITIGVAPPKGLKPLLKFKKGVSRSFYYLVYTIGFGIGFILVVSAMLKIITPSLFGVWYAEHGNSLVVSFNQSDYSAQEIPAIWLALISAMIGTGILYLTYKICRILKRHI
ncbi:HAAS signaling domain-containing protein [Microbulbifer sp. 2304DJ12-6]|uniref:HAAS signaling domain-containing protein n=1 Tax=Microbulbifer sp. 2304DJ12-6 TaxID=3233340 RepID=UPI0039B06E0C